MPLIAYPPGMARARFVSRHKRFTVRLEDAAGHDILAHTNNTGTMLGLVRPGAGALLSPAANPKRKLPWTLEALDFHGTLVGVNTMTPNRMLAAAFAAGRLPELAGYARLTPEARSGDSRLDARLDGRKDGPADQPPCWVECKNVTLVEDGGVALFPDAPTERGRRHLVELMRLARTGARVALFFLVQRADAACFAPAGVVDPEYERLFSAALDAGVEAWPYLAEVTEEGIDLGARLPLA